MNCIHNGKHALLHWPGSMGQRSYLQQEQHAVNGREMKVYELHNRDHPRISGKNKPVIKVAPDNVSVCRIDTDTSNYVHHIFIDCYSFLKVSGGN